MAALAIQNPMVQFADTDGRPLDAGKLYFGVANANPITTPITVYWDAAETLVATQPIATLNGYPIRNGAPAIIYTSSDFSILVRNSADVQVFTAANSADWGTSASLLDKFDDLSSGASAAVGAGMVGNSASVTYSADTAGGALQLRGISVDDGPFEAFTQATTTQRLVALHAAQDRAIAIGVPCIWGAHEYLIPSAFRFKANAVHWFAGIDRTVLKLDSTADEDSNVMEPFAFDGTVTGVCLFGGFTVNGNYSRGAVSGVGASRPGASGFVTAGCQDLAVIGGIKAVDCVLHGIDICNGGEDDGGTLAYVASANQANTYYPANEALRINIDLAIAANCGDDGVTGHYSKDVHIGHVLVQSTGQRHPDDDASNCFEIDDGCRRWQVGSVHAYGGIRGVAIKCHDPEPAPTDIQVGSIFTRQCKSGVWINDASWSAGAPLAAARRITIGQIDVSDPGDPNASSTTPRSGVEIRSYDLVNIGRMVVSADGDEGYTFNSAFQMSSGATNISVGELVAKNWAYNNTSVSTAAAVGVTSSVSNWSIGSVLATSCGYRGVSDSGSDRGHIGKLVLVGDSLASSVGVECNDSLATSGFTIGAMQVSGFTTTSSYGGETRTNPASIARGLQVVSGMLNIGQSVSKTIASGVLTTGDASYVRVAGEGGANDDLATISAGEEGDLLFLRAASSTVDITVKHGTGNIYLNGLADFVLSHAFDSLTLLCTSSGDWVEAGRGNNQT